MAKADNTNNERIPDPCQVDDMLQHVCVVDSIVSIEDLVFCRPRFISRQQARSKGIRPNAHQQA